MQRRVPRLVLAGTNSGCGKTTVTCAVLQALVSRGLRVGAAKCGPDYIDPMFHSRVIGAKSSNLDGFFFDRDTMRYLLAHNGQDCDITVIEGVMGYYDGLGLTSTRASTYEAARETESPVVLVVNARGAALSVVAAVQGFLDFAPDNNVQGVILNGCSAMSYGALARELESRLGVRACGYLPRLTECALESRHLGLVTADEVADLREKLRQLAEAAEKTLELDALLEIAHNAPVLDFTPPVLPEKGAPVRIGVARDRAFCFYYEDSLDLLRQLGAELEGQIEEALRAFPSTGLIFIDTLQMVRDNASAKVNAYAQDYKDLSGLKKLADDHGICIFVVHHTRKERDSSNIFNDMTGSTGILGVADTGMILRKDDRFGDCATLCITGRDVEEKKLKMQMRGVRWEITEALSAKDLRKERIPDFVFQVADFLLAHGRFRGTVSQLLAAVGNTELKPNLASKHLTRHYSDVLLPLGITYEYRKTAAARLVLLELHDGADGHDGSSGSERLASLRKQNDGTFRLPQASSQASSASWEEAEDDEELPL